MSGSRSGFSVSISAVDNASKVIDGLNKRIARANAPVERLQRSFSKLADNTGVRAVSREMRGMADSSARIFANVGRAVPGLAALGGAFGVAGLAEGMKRAQDYGTNLQMTARRAGVGVGALQRLGNAAEISGGSAAGAADSLADLNKNMELAAHSGQGDPKFRAALAAMHVNLRGANGQMRNSASVMDEVLHKLASMKDAQQQLYFGNAALGGSFQTALWPAIQGGTKALDDYLKAAGQMVNLTPQQVEALRAGQAETRRFSTDVENIAFGIMSDLVPAQVQAEGGLSAWIEKNQDFIKQDVETKIHKIAQAFKDAADAVGGWQSAGSVVLEWYASKFFPGIIGRAMKADAVIRGLGEYAKHEGVPGASIAEGAARGAAAGAAVGSMVPLVGTGLGAASGGLGGALWNLDPLGLNDVTPADAWRYLTGKGGAKLPQPIANEVMRRAKEQGLDPAHMLALAGVEAGGYDRVSPAGAIGPMQLMPDTARSVGVNPYEWHQNVRGGVSYYKSLLAKYGDYRKADAAYNWGPGNLDKDISLHGAQWADYLPTETRRYVAQLDGGPAVELAKNQSQSTEHTVKGAATVQVHINGAPAGSRVSASTSGDLFAGAPQVVMPMPPGGGPAG